MSEEVDRTRFGRRSIPFAVVGVLLTAAIVLPLVVPIYARAQPTLAGVPFFYWYQILWVVVDAAILFVCYRILRAVESRHRPVSGADR